MIVGGTTKRCYPHVDTKETKQVVRPTLPGKLRHTTNNETDKTRMATAICWHKQSPEIVGRTRRRSGVVQVVVCHPQEKHRDTSKPAKRTVSVLTSVQDMVEDKQVDDRQNGCR